MQRMSMQQALLSLNSINSCPLNKRRENRRHRSRGVAERQVPVSVKGREGMRYSDAYARRERKAVKPEGIKALISF